MADWLQLKAEVPVERKDALSDALLGLGATGLQEDHPGLHPDDGPLVEEGWTLGEAANPTTVVEITAWFPGTEDGDALCRWLGDRLDVWPAVRRVADEDWNETWKQSWQPGPLSRRILVVPTWMEAPTLEEGQIPFVMDPGLAFGTGTHPTTRGCAAFVDEHLAAHPGARVLDVGTGTGVLAVAALLLGAAHAVGVDTDPQAIAAAEANAAANGVGDRLDLHVGGVDAAPAGTFDVVVANLLARLLLTLAPALVDRVAAGGRIVASGILVAQAPDVISAFAAAGAHLVDRRDSPEWCTLLLERT